MKIRQDVFEVVECVKVRTGVELEVDESPKVVVGSGEGVVEVRTWTDMMVEA